MATVYNCKIEVKSEQHVVYWDIYGTDRPGTICLEKLDEDVLNRFNYWITKERLTERGDFELLWRYLYDILFPPGSNQRKDLENNYDFLKGSGSRLRLSLIFH